MNRSPSRVTTLLPLRTGLAAPWIRSGRSWIGPDVINGVSCGRLVGELEIGSQLLADQIFLNLPADHERKAGHESHLTRDLIMCDPPPAELHDLILRGRHSRAQPDARADNLSILRIRNTDHGYVEDGLLAIEEFFDFGRRDVFAAANDHVLHASDDVAVALVVDHR